MVDQGIKTSNQTENIIFVSGVWQLCAILLCVLYAVVLWKCAERLRIKSCKRRCDFWYTKFAFFCNPTYFKNCTGHINYLEQQQSHKCNYFSRSQIPSDLRLQVFIPLKNDGNATLHIFKLDSTPFRRIVRPSFFSSGFLPNLSSSDLKSQWVCRVCPKVVSLTDDTILVYKTVLHMVEKSPQNVSFRTSSIS